MARWDISFLRTKVRAMTGYLIPDTEENKNLILSTFTHPNYKTKYHYERLEFFGDRILALVIAEWLYQEHTNNNEGFLSKELARLVSKPSLIKIAEDLELKPLLRMGRSGKDMDDRAIASALVNCLEALIALLYLTGGLEVARDFIKTYWQDILQQDGNIINNPRGMLQELLQRRKLPDAIYRTVESKGPDHDPKFVIELSTVLGEVIAEAPTKKGAMALASEKLLRQLDHKDNLAKNQNIKIK